MNDAGGVRAEHERSVEAPALNMKSPLAGGSCYP